MDLENFFPTVIRARTIAFTVHLLVGSRGDIISRPSQLDLGVRVSPHPAPDVLSFRFCSCVDNRGNFREPLRGY